MSKEVKIAIIGAGRAAEKLYVPTLPKVAGGSVVAVTDTREDRRDLIASSFSGCKAYATLEEMMADAKPDGVIIATPPAAHLPVAKDVLAQDANCFILVEKPLAEDLGEARQLAESMPQARHKIMVGYNRRQWLPVQRLKQALSGKPLDGATVDAAFCIDVSGWDPLTGAVDPLDDLGTHYLDLVRYILDDEIKTLSATRPTERRIDIKLTTLKGANVTLRHEHGPDTYEFFDVTFKDGQRFRLQMGSDRITPASGLGRKLGDNLDKVKRKLTGGGWTLGDSYVLQFETFYAAIRGDGELSPNYDDGVKSMLAVDAARRSAAGDGDTINVEA